MTGERADAGDGTPTVGRRWQWLLAVAIALEVAGTLCLRLSEGFTVPLWTAGVCVGYLTSIVVFARALADGACLAVAYGTLTGTGLVVATVASALLFSEPISLVTVLGMLALVVGVVALQHGTGRTGGAAGIRGTEPG